MDNDCKFSEQGFPVQRDFGFGGVRRLGSASWLDLAYFAGRTTFLRAVAGEHAGDSNVVS
jgi:hypothetical protein